MHRKSRIYQCCRPLILLSLLFPISALSEPPAGRLLTSQCGQCHGTNGTGYEHLAGKNASEIYNEVMEMHDPKRPVEGIMDLQARGYTTEQIWAISQYLATLPRTPGAN